jgi:hypothetical protein
MSILEAAVLGAAVGLIIAVLNNTTKNNKYKKLLASINLPFEYAGLYHYASAKRYKKSFKYFDSYGALYLSGNTAYYKSSVNTPPVSFDLSQCSVQQEPDWRWVKWFSITTPAGEKYYFDSNKMGFFVNDSSETLKGLAALKAKSSKTIQS